MKKSLLKKFPLPLFIFILFAALIVFIAFHLDYQKLISLIREQGYKGQLIFFAYITISTIFSPLNSLILFPVALLAFGYWRTILLIFAGNSLGSIVNFLIARKLGRPAVRKIIGKNALDKVDVFTDIAGWKAFLLIRILGSNYSDYISYAVGLTKFPFLTYILITLPVYFIWTATILYILDKAIVLKNVNAAILVAVSYFLSLATGLYVWRKYKKKYKKH